MTDHGLCAIVLAAGAGTRLQPLTGLRPKALCPVGNVPLLDRALSRLDALGLSGADRVAVNAHHHAEQIATAVAGRARLSVEQPEPLGTAGAIAVLHEWVAGRDVLVLNADAYLAGPLPGDFIDGWTADHARLLVVDAGDRRRDFDNWRFAGLSLLPSAAAARLRPEPTGLYEVVWRDARAAGRLELSAFDGTFVDCGTPADYLAANLHARVSDAQPAYVAGTTPRANAPCAGAQAALGVDPAAVVTGHATDSVIGRGAVVAGRVVRCVVWPGARVEADEVLSDAVRADGGLTVSA